MPRPMAASRGAAQVFQNMWGVCDLTGKRTILKDFPHLIAIASNLLDDDGVNALVLLGFCSGSWTDIMCRREVPLPTQDCRCHLP